jgi:hypothetical protein
MVFIYNYVFLVMLNIDIMGVSGSRINTCENLALHLAGM